jgi:hypothetical protein
VFHWGTTRAAFVIDPRDNHRSLRNDSQSLLRVHTPLKMRLPDGVTSVSKLLAASSFVALTPGPAPPRRTVDITTTTTTTTATTTLDNDKSEGAGVTLNSEPIDSATKVVRVEWRRATLQSMQRRRAERLVLVGSWCGVPADHSREQPLALADIAAQWKSGEPILLASGGDVVSFGAFDYEKLRDRLYAARYDTINDYPLVNFDDHGYWL